jgi:N-acetylglucosamine kinase-like BadF-type ATPase
LYRQPPPVREVARHADVILNAAALGDPFAHEIVGRGAAALATLARTAMRNVRAEPAIRFCGGLLTSDNALSRALCRQLGLDDIPYPLHPPVVGAALLAKLTG